MTEQDRKLIHLQNTLTRALNQAGYKEINYLEGEGIEARLEGKKIIIKITVKDDHH